jgi:aspartate kinase
VVAVVSAAGGATDRITRMLAAVSAGRPHPREADRALATGEDLSAALLASALAALGVPARSLRGGEAGVRVEGGFCGGRIARIDPAPLRSLLDAGLVPVVSGFQGARADGETVTLGRGASDLSAVAIAAALGAAECHIVTDVAGVFDRDPRVDAAARVFPRLTHGELLRLAVDGAKVVHPEAAREAQRSGVPLRIHHFRAPFEGDHGTVVTATPRPPRPVSPIEPPAAEIPTRESAQADFGPLLPRIHSPVPTFPACPTFPALPATPAAEVPA